MGTPVKTVSGVFCFAIFSADESKFYTMISDHITIKKEVWANEKL